MSDEIKQIAALIGHHQALEKRVSTLTEEFQAASVQLGEHEKPRGSHRMMPSTGVKITTIIS